MYNKWADDATRIFSCYVCRSRESTEWVVTLFCAENSS